MFRVQYLYSYNFQTDLKVNKSRVKIFHWIKFTSNGHIKDPSDLPLCCKPMVSNVHLGLETWYASSLRKWTFTSFQALNSLFHRISLRIINNHRSSFEANNSRQTSSHLDDLFPLKVEVLRQTQLIHFHFSKWWCIWMYTNYTKVIINRKKTDRVLLWLLTSKPFELILKGKKINPKSQSPIKAIPCFDIYFPKAPSTSQQLLHFSMPSGAGEQGNSGPTKDTSPMMLIFNTLAGREGGGNSWPEEKVGKRGTVTW